MKSRYGALHTIGTLAVILAWVLLALGVIAFLATWLGLGGLLRSLEVSAGAIPLTVALPGLLLGIIGFLQFYVLGKTLQLLVGLDDTTRGITADLKKVQPGDSAQEISGELNRQAKLISETVETTRQIKDQVANIETMLTPAIPAPVEEVIEEIGDDEGGD